MGELPTVSIWELRTHLVDIIDRADRDHEPTVITRRGKRVAAVVPIDLLRNFQLYEKQAVIRMVDERMGNTVPGAPMEEIMADLSSGE